MAAAPCPARPSGLHFPERKNRDLRGWLLLAWMQKALPDAGQQSPILDAKNYRERKAGQNLQGGAQGLRLEGFRNLGT
jgi:hypothetical protein